MIQHVCRDCTIQRTSILRRLDCNRSIIERSTARKGNLLGICYRSGLFGGCSLVVKLSLAGPHVNQKSDHVQVELIGCVDEPGNNGPQNGMYALQKELRKRIDEGLDWLSIKSLPVSKGAIPWFWNWNDRRYARR